MMGNVPFSNLSEICERLHQGLNTAGEKIKFYDTGYPIIQTRNIDNGVVELDNKIKFVSKEDWLFYKDKYKPEIGDVFFTNIGTIGKTAVITSERDYLIHWNIFKLKPMKEKITSAYLRYALEHLTISGYFSKLQKGGTVNFVTKKMISEAQIFLPFLSEQQRIVTILDEAFEGIATATANAKKNLANACELFESYLQSVFENNDAGWEKMELMEVCEQITDGSHFSPKSSSDDEYPYITVRDIDDDIVNFENCKFISKSNYLSLLKNGCKPNFGDLLFSKDGTVGKVSLVDFEKDFVVLSSLAIIRPKRKIIISSLLKYVLKNPAFLQKAVGMKTGVAIRRIILKNLKLIKINFPKSLTEQQTIVAKLDELYTETKKLEAIYQQKLNALEELKKSILNQAFSGNL
jgi:type I restriction enzyme, S subunit